MPTETAAITRQTANNKLSPEPHKRVTKKFGLLATMAARRQASARYREKNLEEEREKARVRMARYREKIREQDDLAEDARAPLAHWQQILRMEAYGKKHGHRAWLEHHNLLEERRAEAREHEELAALRHLYSGDAMAGRDAQKTQKKMRKYLWKLQAAQLRSTPSPVTVLENPKQKRGRRIKVVQELGHVLGLLLCEALPPEICDCGPENEARLSLLDFFRCLPHACSGMPHCQPTYWHESGREDPFTFCAKGNKLYVVTNGTVCGIFSSEARARKQIEGVSNGRWRVVKTWEAAIEIWNDSCDVFHDTGCPALVPLAVPRSVTPATKSPPAKKTPTRQMARKVQDPSVRHFGMSLPFSSAAGPPPSPSPASASRGTLLLSRPSPSTATPNPFSIHTPPSTIQECRDEVTWPNSFHAAPNTFCVHTTPNESAREVAKRRIFSAPSVEDGRGGSFFSYGGAQSRCAATRQAVGHRRRQQILCRKARFAICLIICASTHSKYRIDAVDHILTLHLGQADLMGSRNVKKLRAFIRHKVYVPGPSDARYSDEE
ncbi:hypothetical protein B0H14DRAFT_2561879 [Mycena olivaceomarginata]|nr:hypothetical protein B0H14DRAFT_2561879 [Mycena olivaceomarginata]